MGFSTSMIMQGAAEMVAYGTAVKLKWVPPINWMLADTVASHNGTAVKLK
jgi:hypothetical protein